MEHKHQNEFGGVKYFLFMYRTHCEISMPRDCKKCRFYRLLQPPLDVTALAGFLDYYTTVVRVSDEMFPTLIKYDQISQTQHN